MVKKQECKEEQSKEEHCVNPCVFQEYITAARLVYWQAHFPLFSVWLFILIYICYCLKRDFNLLYTFISFIFFSNSENDLEEVLTFYTQKNKSATVFLGTKVRSVKKDIHEVNASGDSGNCENSKSEFLLWCFFSLIFLLL